MDFNKNQKKNMQYQHQEMKEKQKENTFSSTGENVQFSFDLKQSQNEQLFMRSPRSQAYMDIIASIDLLSATDEAIMEKLKEVVDEDTLEEFSEMTTEELLEELRLSFEDEMAQKEMKLEECQDMLFGVISKCYITGCYVHAIDRKGNILEHYKKNEKLPLALSRARDEYTKCNGDCSCVEAYRWCSRVIGLDGSVTEIYYDEAADE